MLHTFTRLRRFCTQACETAVSDATAYEMGVSPIKANVPCLLKITFYRFTISCVINYLVQYCIPLRPRQAHPFPWTRKRMQKASFTRLDARSCDKCGQYFYCLTSPFVRNMPAAGALNAALFPCGLLARLPNGSSE